MARNKGLLNISAGFEPNIAEPFDARTRVPLYSDLTNSITYGSYAYIGMIVTVYNDGTNNGAYLLKALPYTNTANWEKLVSGAVSTSRWEPTTSTVSYDDYYVPSYDELYELYYNRATLISAGASLPGNESAWSSTEVTASTARCVNLTSGGQSSPTKTNSFATPYIRDFISPKTYMIGDRGQNGFIFIIVDLGNGFKKYYEYSGYQTGPWQAVGSTLTGATSTIIGTGKANTTLIGTTLNDGNFSTIRDIYLLTTNTSMNNTHISPLLNKGLYVNRISYFNDDLVALTNITTNTIKIRTETLPFRITKSDGITTIISIDGVNKTVGMGVNTPETNYNLTLQGSSTINSGVMIKNAAGTNVATVHYDNNSNSYSIGTIVGGGDVNLLVDGGIALYLQAANRYLGVGANLITGVLPDRHLTIYENTLSPIGIKIRNGYSSAEILAGITNDTLGFYVAGVERLRVDDDNVRLKKISPFTDSATAIQFTKADKITPVMTIDTINSIIFNGVGSQLATTADIIKYSIIFG